MRNVKLLCAAALLCAAQGAVADDSFQSALQRGAAVHPSQYSFADLYRASVAAPTAALFPLSSSDTPARVASAQAPSQLFVAEVGEPNVAMLLLSGIALAAWVARRRLGYGLR